MPHPLNRSEVGRYAESFSKYKELKEQGFSFLIDVSGTLFTKPKPSLRDVAGNTQAMVSLLTVEKSFLAIVCVHSLQELVLVCQAIEAVLMCMSRGRFSAHILSDAICTFYEKHGLYPKGIISEMECIQEWSKRMGLALQRLDTSTYNLQKPNF